MVFPSIAIGYLYYVSHKLGRLRTPRGRAPYHFTALISGSVLYSNHSLHCSHLTKRSTTMNTSTKYLLIGLILGLAIMFFINAGGASPGRYQLHAEEVFSIYEEKLTFYILDTQTGIAKKFYSRNSVIAKFNN